MSTTTLSAYSSTHTACIAVPTTATCPDGNGSIIQALDASLFRLDCNLDYPGYDVDACAGASIDVCLQICDARGATCGGVVWVPKFLGLVPGYTCFFKSSLSVAVGVQELYVTNSLVRLTNTSQIATGISPICPDSNGQTYTGSDSSLYRIDCNTAYNGAISLMVNAGSLQVCIDRCTAAGNLCAAACYSPSGQGLSSQPECQLRTTLGVMVGVSYVVHSVVRIGPPTLSYPPAVTCSAG